MLGLLEKVSWNNARLKLFAQDLHEFFRTSCPQPWKHGRAETARLTIEVRMFSQEFVHQHAIRFQHCARSIAHAIEIVESNHSEKLCWMHGTSVGKVDDLPHALHQLGLRQNPS